MSTTAQTPAAPAPKAAAPPKAAIPAPPVAAPPAQAQPAAPVGTPVAPPQGLSVESQNALRDEHARAIARSEHNRQALGTRRDADDRLSAATQAALDAQRSEQLGIVPPAPDGSPEKAVQSLPPLVPPAPQAQAQTPNIDLNALMANPEMLDKIGLIVDAVRAQRAPKAQAETAAAPAAPAVPAEPNWLERAKALGDQITQTLVEKGRRKIPRAKLNENDEPTIVYEEVNEFDPNSLMGQLLLESKVREAVQAEQQEYLRTVNEAHRTASERRRAAEENARREAGVKAYRAAVDTAVEAVLSGRMKAADGTIPGDLIPKNADGTVSQRARTRFQDAVLAVEFDPEFQKWDAENRSAKQALGYSPAEINSQTIAMLMGFAWERSRYDLTAGTNTSNTSTTVTATDGNVHNAQTGTQNPANPAAPPPPQGTSALPKVMHGNYESMEAQHPTGLPPGGPDPSPLQRARAEGRPYTSRSLSDEQLRFAVQQAQNETRRSVFGQ